MTKPRYASSPEVGHDLRARRLPAPPVHLLLAALLLAAGTGSGNGVSPPPAAPLQAVLQGEDFHARQEAAARLGRNLDNNAIEALIALLELPALPPLDPAEAVALKDIVCTVLENQAAYPAELPTRLIAMFRDHRQDPVWRDYCIQHLNTACTKIPPAQRPPIYELFWEATAETAATIVGTALIALTDHRADPAIPLPRLRDTALQIATADTTSTASRLTAIQIAAELGDTRILPFARELAREPATERPLRLSAIAAIGALGSPEDLPLLHDLAAATGHVPSFAARTARQKIHSRHPETNFP